MRKKHVPTKLEKLGAFFRATRLRRGLTLDEAGDGWSAATLSRFERGIIDIGSDRAITLMLRLGMNEKDLLELTEPNLANFPLNMQDAIQMNDRETISARYAAYQAAHPQETSVTKLAKVLFEAGLHWPDADYRLSVAGEQIVANRLSIPERFNLMEAEVLKAIAGPASHELLELLWTRTKRIPDDWRQVSEMQVLLIWLGALMNRDMELVDAIEPELQQFFTEWAKRPYIVEFYPNWHYGRRVAAWLRNPSSENRAAVEATIAALTNAGIVTDARWFQLMFARTQNGAVHHNDELVDKMLPLVTNDTAGAVMRARRKHLGLTVLDFKGIAAAATISRFEKNHNQMGFGALVEICAELCMLPSQVLVKLRQDEHNGNGTLTLAAATVEIDQTDGNREAAAAVVAKFMAQFAEYSPKIAEKQQFVLRNRAGLGEEYRAEMFEAAPRLLKRLLSMQQWATLELKLTAELVDWLDCQQVGELLAHARQMLAASAEPVEHASFYVAANKAIQRASDQCTDAACHDLVDQLSFLTADPAPYPEAWLATGSWYIAQYSAQPDEQHLAQVEKYIAQTLAIGHPDAAANVLRFGAGKLPDAVLAPLQGAFGD